MSSSFLQRLYTAGETLINKSIRLVGGRTPADGVQSFSLDRYKSLHIALPDDGPTVDVFGRMRTSFPHSLFEVTHVFDKQPQIMVEQSANGASQTFNAGKSSVDMVVTSTTNSRARRRSKYYLPYEPGRSPLAQMTGVFGTGLTGIKKRIGLFDDNDGFYFEQFGPNANDYRVVVRNSLGADESIDRSSWDDPLDGSGPSGLSVDLSTGRIFVIEFAWLGYGPVRFGVQVGPKVRYCHVVEHTASPLSAPYTKRGTLPIQYEIVNETGVAVTPGTNDTLVHTCSSYFSEGGFDPLGKKGSAKNDGPRNVGDVAPVPILSIRLKSAYKEGLLRPLNFGLVSLGDKTNLGQLVVGGTLTGASWTSIPGVDATEKDQSATAISGGRAISTELLTGKNSVQLDANFRNLPGLNYAGNVDIVSLVVTRLTGGSDDYHGTINFEEVY